MPTLVLDCQLKPEQSPGLHQGTIRYALPQYQIHTDALIGLSVRAHLALRRIGEQGLPARVEVLTEALLEAGLQQGKLALPANKPVADFEAVEALEVKRALKAFARAEFQLLIDGELIREPRLLSLHETSHVVFLRLLPLVGG